MLEENAKTSACRHDLRRPKTSRLTSMISELDAMFVMRLHVAVLVERKWHSATRQRAKIGEMTPKRKLNPPHTSESQRRRPLSPQSPQFQFCPSWEASYSRTVSGQRTNGLRIEPMALCSTMNDVISGISPTCPQAPELRSGTEIRFQRSLRKLLIQKSEVV